VLLMEFIGRDGMAAPRLKDIPVDILTEDLDLEELFLRIVSAMKTLYEKGTMVHADLSEFNIVMNGYVERELGPAAKAGAEAEIEIEPVIIDLGQAVLSDHPNADAFLLRDARNIVTYFNKHGLGHSEDEVMAMVKG
jgi:RIO kinase 1